jgi:hypothetical protein
VFEVGETCRPGLGVLVDPAVMQEPDGDDVEEVQLLASATARDDQTGVFEELEVLHDAKTRHRKTFFKLGEALAVPLEELVEEGTASWVGEGLEDDVH